MQNIRIHSSSDKRIKADAKGLVDEPLRCAFSTVRSVKVGTGTTARKQETRHLWYVETLGDGTYGVRKVNPQFVPVGKESVVDRETLLAEYTPEVDLYNSRIKPAIVKLDKTLDVADGHRERNEPLSAEMEYSKALDVDETNVRATFGLGLVYLGRNDREKSRVIFDELVGLDAAFEARHKHLFNEFGINLRKNSLFSEAVQYYTRALDINKESGEDENLCYNLARAYYEMGEWGHCLEFASRTLAVNDHHEFALSLCRLALALSGKPKLQEKYGKPPVPPDVADKAADLLGVKNGDRDLIVAEGMGLGDDMTISLGDQVPDVSKRLEITIFGSMYRVAAIRFTRSMAKAGIQLYGSQEWNSMINAIALGKNRRKLMEQVGHTLGQGLSIEYRAEGVMMQGAEFGLEVFHGGRFTPLDVVEAENRTVRPRDLMQGWSKEDMLGVFWGRCDGAMSFQWDDVDVLDGQEVALVLARMSSLLNSKRAFDLVTDVTWKGLKGCRKSGESKGGFQPLKQVFHVID